MSYGNAKIDMYMKMVESGTSHTDAFRATTAYWAMDQAMSDRFLAAIAEL